MIDPQLLFALIQSQQREHWQQREQLRLSRAACSPHPRLHHHVLAALGGALITAGQQIHTWSHSQLAFRQECCVPCV
jgi:hypothetical protein